MLIPEGFGDFFIGEAELREDGSYVTTEWFVFCWIPISPNKSYRVKPKSKESNITLTGIKTTSKYNLIEEVSLNKEQIKSVRRFLKIGVIFFIILLILYFFTFETLSYI